MIKSMTGYGKHSINEGVKSVTVEIRTLNSKQLDVNLRLPQTVKEREIEIRKLISSVLIRGKIDVSINYESSGADTAPVIDFEIAKHYYDQLTQLIKLTNDEKPNNLIDTIIKMPDVLVQKEAVVSNDELDMILDCVKKAIAEVDVSRHEEGIDLEKDFINRINKIIKYLIDVEEIDVLRIPRIRDRILSNIESYMNNPETDKNRLEQEIIYYIEKLDITEEKVRLKNNCNYFLENLNNSDSSGKKLAFISQEIGREINTLGSKANDSDLQRIVVLMKDELEKIKEQLFNIL